MTKTTADHVEKATLEETTAKAPTLYLREARNAWTRAATAWTAAAFSVDESSDSAGRYALAALRAARNAERVATGKKPL